MRIVQHWVVRLIGSAAPMLLIGCAGLHRDVSLPIDDPYEQSNRSAFAASHAVLHPVSQVVKAVTPGPIHDRLHDLDANLQEPRIFANDLLQLRLDSAAKTAGRFLINSTVGIGGLFDVAASAGIPQQSGDFGQTLFVWGVESGPYTYMLYYGPSTTRDSLGVFVDTIGDPLGWILAAPLGVAGYVGPGVVDGFARLSEYKEAEEASIDFYSFLRSAYYQTRRAQLREAVGLPPLVESPATATAAPAR